MISTRVLIGILMVLLGLMGYQMAASKNPALVSSTPFHSPTPIPSRVADGNGPILVASADGSILTSAVPDFRFSGLRQSFTHEIHIRNAKGEVVIWTPGKSESPLPAGDYTWQACAIGYFDPTPKCSDMIWSFEITSRTARPMQTPTPVVSPTPTITPLATSELPPIPPMLIAPADGAVLASGLPNFQYEVVPNAQAYEIWIYGDDDFEAVWVVSGFDVTGMYAGYPYTPTPTVLPDGEYEWAVCAKRYSSGRGICSQERWAFTIQAE